jgi:DNA-binding MarR family transcriptional regulator
VKYHHDMSIDPTRSAVLDSVFELVVLLEEDMTSSLAALGLTRSRTALLWTLTLTGPAPQRELAERMRVSPRNVTGLVDALVGTGFVTREPHPTDRRAALVTLTRHGEAVMRRMRSDHEELGEVLLGHLSPRQLGSFRRALDGLVHRLRDRLAEETPGA